MTRRHPDIHAPAIRRVRCLLGTTPSPGADGDLGGHLPGSLFSDPRGRLTRAAGQIDQASNDMTLRHCNIHAPPFGGCAALVVGSLVLGPLGTCQVACQVHSLDVERLRRKATAPPVFRWLSFRQSYATGPSFPANLLARQPPGQAARISPVNPAFTWLPFRQSNAVRHPWVRIHANRWGLVIIRVVHGKKFEPNSTQIRCKLEVNSN